MNKFDLNVFMNEVNKILKDLKSEEFKENFDFIENYVEQIIALNNCTLFNAKEDHNDQLTSKNSSNVIEKEILKRKTLFKLNNLFNEKFELINFLT